MKNQTSDIIAYITLLLIALAVALGSCKKKDKDDSEPTPAVDLSNEGDFLLAETLADDANRETDVVLKDTLFYKTNADFCRYVIKDNIQIKGGNHHQKLLRLI